MPVSVAGGAGAQYENIVKVEVDILVVVKLASQVLPYPLGWSGLKSIFAGTARVSLI